MGFIEDEKRRKAAERTPYEQYWQKWKEENDKKEKEERILSEEACRQFVKSGLNEMVGKLGRAGLYKWTQASTGNGKLTVTICITPLSFIDIVATADGNMRMEGDRDSGSMSLSKDQWQGKTGQEALEEALGKVYKNPRTIPFGYGGGGGDSHGEQN